MSRKLLKLGAIGASSILGYKHVQSSKYQPKFPQFLLAEELCNGGGGKKLGHHGTDQCILVIGTTGTGKSSTISKCTGQSVEVSDRADSVTRKCQIFSDLNKSSRPVWIDTVGYDDTTRLDDEESFKSVLKFIQEENLLKIKAIIWTILPQERKDARLQVTFLLKFGNQGQHYCNSRDRRSSLTGFERKRSGAMSSSSPSSQGASVWRNPARAPRRPPKC